MKLLGATFLIGIFTFATQSAASTIEDIKNSILSKAKEGLNSILSSFQSKADVNDFDISGGKYTQFEKKDEDDSGLNEEEFMDLGITWDLDLNL